MDNDSSRKAEFETWLVQARPGDSFVYSTGFGPVEETAEAAKQAYASGHIELTQRLQKDTNGKRAGFDYIATKKRVVRVPRVNGEPWQTRLVTHRRA